tara:strand:+ start:456 stop:644 length:189 start_codon:yes stop_codon:yes gene_type:complete
MSLFEKIAFLESFFKLFEIDKKVQLNTEHDVDYLLIKVSKQLKELQVEDAKKQIDEMPLFYN